MLERQDVADREPATSAVLVGELFGVNVPIFALADETCRSLATRLAVHGLERLPVVSDAQSRRLIGIVSRSDLIKPALSLHAEELERQTVRRVWPQALK
jgi:CBS domain-containing protein